MIMNGKEISSIKELKRNFSIDELIYSFYIGELEIWLNKLGETALADKLSQISFNGYALEKLYRLFGIDPILTENEVHELFRD